MKRRTLYILPVVILCQGLYGQGRDMDAAYAFNKAQEFHYVNRDSAYFYYEEAISLSDTQNDLDYFFMAQSYLINANGHFYDLPDYKRNIERLDSILQYDKRVENFEWADYYRNYILFDRGNYYYKTKEYTTSKKYFIALYNKIEDFAPDGLFLDDIEMLSSINSFLGLINYHTGKYEQAEYTFRRDIELIKNHADSLSDWQSSLISSKKLLSQVYEVQNRHEEAGLLLNEALEFYSVRSADPKYENSHLSTLLLVAKNLCEQEDYQKALDVLGQREYLANNPFSREMSLVEGDAYLGQNKIAKALEKYEDGLSGYLEFRQNQPHQDIAAAYIKMVKFYLDQGRYNEGIQNLLKAFNASGANINVASVHENPNPQDVFSKRQLLQLLDIKLQLLQMAYSKTNDDEYLEVAIQTNKDILGTFDLLKKEFDSKLDKQFLAEKAYPIFHRMLAVAYTAYEKNPSTETLQLALNIAEKNKDFVLLEALRNAQATQYGDVPQEVLDKEAQLRAEITHLEKKIFDAAETESGFSDNLFKLKQDYYGLLDTIKTKYPKYHDLKYRTEFLDLAVIRDKLLGEKGTLISYSMSENHLYAIVLEQSNEKFLKLPFSGREREAVHNFYRLLSKPAINGAEEEITVLGERLFEKILKKPLKDGDAENLTIIPDGELHYLPFDLLRKNGSYLLETKNVGYANSVASLMELNDKKTNDDNKVLAFAPSFDDAVAINTDRQFGKLRYNDDEVSKIGAFYETETVLNERATLANFISKTSDFNVFHLATHASANDEYPDYSYLAFSQENDSSESNILYIKDLYNTTLNADMVTLSACQTGIGKLQKGQGMLSLSKGFYYAGAKSLVNTLWKINDKSSVKLMAYFYEGLSSGKSKTKALRDAKLKYLANTDDDLLRHPYYWSAFVVSGDVSPISETNYWWYVGASVLFFVILFISSKVQGKSKRFKRISFRPVS